MSRLEKMKARILKEPTASDITSTELKNFLKAYGFELKRISGDHFIFSHPKLKMPLPAIPMPKIIKQCYIDRIRTAIYEIDGENYE